MTRTVDEVTADRQLKARHRAMWAAGNCPAVATELIPALGPELVAACAVTSGQRVLDVAADAGNAAIPAAATGASVTAADLTPELFEAGRGAAARAGVELDWVEADAEACRSTPTGSTSSCPAWAPCSPRATAGRRTSWSACADPGAPSE